MYVKNHSKPFFVCRIWSIFRYDDLDLRHPKIEECEWYIRPSRLQFHIKYLINYQQTNFLHTTTSAFDMWTSTTTMICTYVSTDIIKRIKFCHNFSKATFAKYLTFHLLTLNLLSYVVISGGIITLKMLKRKHQLPECCAAQSIIIC